MLKWHYDYFDPIKQKNTNKILFYNMAKSRKNVRKNRKSRKGGLFGIKAFKTEWDNKNNCMSINKLSSRCTPAWLERYDYHSNGSKDVKPGPYKYPTPSFN